LDEILGRLVERGGVDPGFLQGGHPAQEARLGLVLSLKKLLQILEAAADQQPADEQTEDDQEAEHTHPSILPEKQKTQRTARTARTKAGDRFQSLQSLQSLMFFAVRCYLK